MALIALLLGFVLFDSLSEHNAFGSSLGTYTTQPFIPVHKPKKVRGINPAIKFSSGQNQGIESPLLLWGAARRWMRFKFEMTAENPKLTVLNEVICYQDLSGTIIADTWSTLTTLEKKLSKTIGYRCVSLRHKNESDSCTTFRVKTTVTVKHGYLTISDIKFGTKKICKSNSSKTKSFKCNFDDGDCDFQNDACGLVDWEIRDSYSNNRRKRSTECGEQKGVSLLKRKIRDRCSYEDLDIVNLQQSGFIQFTTTLDVESTVASTSQVPSRRRRTYGRSLYLDPSSVRGVATGVLDLPDVVYHNANAFLSFDCEMVEGGYHDLMVTAVCLSDSSNSLIPLRSGSVHFHVSNFDGNGVSESICIDLHSYIDKDKCSEFAIQIYASAVETSVIVDDFEFVENLIETYCDRASNADEET